MREQVPTLVDGETKVIDSTIILEYLEDKFGRSLLPATPAERSKARAIEDIVQTVYESINWGYAEIVWGKRATGELAEHLKAQVREQTAAVHQCECECCEMYACRADQRCSHLAQGSLGSWEASRTSTETHSAGQTLPSHP